MLHANHFWQLRLATECLKIWKVWFAMQQQKQSYIQFKNEILGYSYVANLKQQLTVFAL